MPPHFFHVINYLLQSSQAPTSTDICCSEHRIISHTACPIAPLRSATLRHLRGVVTSPAAPTQFPPSNLSSPNHWTGTFIRHATGLYRLPKLARSHGTTMWNPPGLRTPAPGAGLALGITQQQPSCGKLGSSCWPSRLVNQICHARLYATSNNPREVARHRNGLHDTRYLKHTLVTLPFQPHPAQALNQRSPTPIAPAKEPSPSIQALVYPPPPTTSPFTARGG